MPRVYHRCPRHPAEVYSPPRGCPSCQAAKERRRGTARQRYGPAWEKVRELVLQRDRTCRWCGAPATEVDHLTPRARGGEHTPENLVASCRRCNLRRGARGAR